jgi:hypothetical protein
VGSSTSENQYGPPRSVTGIALIYFFFNLPGHDASKSASGIAYNYEFVLIPYLYELLNVALNKSTKKSHGISGKHFSPKVFFLER